MNYVAQSRGYKFEPPNQSDPTQARPGSPQKLQIMAERYRSGQPLHHPNDETLVALPVRKAMSAFLRELASKSMNRIEGWCHREDTLLKQMNMNTQPKPDGAPW